MTPLRGCRCRVGGAMSREWKPGDVAMVTYRLGQCIEKNLCAKTDKGWQRLAPGVGFLMHGDVIDALPLLVIDPEDREQVERLSEAASKWADRVPYSDMREPGDLTPLDAMQEALRSLLTPPKPEEPMGLGAVVEDADGVLWTRFARVYDFHAHWSHETADKGNRAYRDIAAVRVLSEGVTTDV